MDRARDRDRAMGHYVALRFLVVVSTSLLVTASEFSYSFLGKRAGTAPSTARQTCTSRELTGPASEVLQGAHLHVFEMVWPPYAFKDNSTSTGWAGLDIELFSEVANVLGFTFEVHETELLAGETYTAHLLRTIGSTDLWLSWWMRDKTRMEGAVQLFGHVDASPVLVAPPPATRSTSDSLVASLFRWLLAFANSWLL